jgi:hypothetical protein
MRTTTPARVARPVALIVAIAGITAAMACSDVTAPSAPRVTPGPDAAFSGYALASGKVDSTSTSTTKTH